MAVKGCYDCIHNCMHTNTQKGYCCLFYSSLSKEELYKTSCAQFEDKRKGCNNDNR